MRKIGNIITTSKMPDYTRLFNVVDDIDDADRSIPTIIIGVQNAREELDNRFNVLDKCYDGGMMWWTYRKNERRADFEDDMSAFVKFCVEKVAKSIEYVYVDLPKIGVNGVKRFIRYIDNGDIKLCHVTNGDSFMFIYDEKKSMSFGLSLSLCEYVGVKGEKVIDRVRRNKNNVIIDNFSKVNNLVRRYINEYEYCKCVFQ